MKEKWSFKGIAVFDHEEKRFWNRNEVKDLALLFWKDAEMQKKNPTADELIEMFKIEFDTFTDQKTYSKKFWDDDGRWEMIEIPYHFGFGIIEGDVKRFKELVSENFECKKTR